MPRLQKMPLKETIEKPREFTDDVWIIGQTCRCERCRGPGPGDRVSYVRVFRGDSANMGAYGGSRVLRFFAAKSCV